VLSHVVGAAGFFEHQERWNTTQPSASRHFERSIHVATFQTERNEADTLRIRNELANTPINNSERAWNCQTWVGDALGRLRNVGLLPEERVTRAADEMADVIMEAPNDEED
jgi:hypothetical protein